MTGKRAAEDFRVGRRVAFYNISIDKLSFDRAPKSEGGMGWRWFFFFFGENPFPRRVVTLFRFILNL